VQTVKIHQRQKLGRIIAKEMKNREKMRIEDEDFLCWRSRRGIGEA